MVKLSELAKGVNRMKKFLTVILVIVLMANFVRPFSEAKASSYSRLEQLIAHGNVPQYVKTTGKFYFNPKFGEHDGLVPTGIVMPTTNVNLRAEPNANAEKLGVISPQNPSQWPTYCGEWTTPEGRRWVLGELTIDDGKIHDANNPARTILVWIFGKYTELVDEEMYSMILDGAAETGLEVSGGDSYNSSRSEAYENIEVMTADQLAAELRANSARLEHKFGGKTVTVRGKVYEIKNSQRSHAEQRNMPCVRFWVGNEWIECFFSENASSVYDLNAGDYVTIQGTLYVPGSWIEITDCRILAR